MSLSATRTGRPAWPTYWGRIVCQFSNSRNVTLRDRHLRQDIISMIRLAQRQAPWLSDGRKHPIARSVYAVRQASFPSPEAQARHDTPIAPTPRAIIAIAPRYFTSPKLPQTQCRGLQKPAPASLGPRGLPGPEEARCRPGPVVFQLGLCRSPMPSPRSSEPR